MINARVNNHLETIVNRGIAAILLSGIRAGIKVMNEGQVPSHIIARIILSPKSHRATD